MFFKHTVDVYIHQVGGPDAASEKIIGLLTQLNRKVNTMASKQDMQQAIEAERAQIVEAIRKMNEDQDTKTKALEDKIVELQAQVDGGAAVTSADFDELKVMVEGIYNPPEVPLPDPVEVPA